MEANVDVFTVDNHKVLPVQGRVGLTVIKGRPQPGGHIGRAFWDGLSRAGGGGGEGEAGCKAGGEEVGEVCHDECPYLLGDGRQVGERLG